MRKYLFLVTLISLVFTACHTEKGELSHTFYLGTYTTGESEGIYKYRLDNTGQLSGLGLVAYADNPSFLALSNDGKVLFAVNEVNRDSIGEVKSFMVKGDTLMVISTASSGGAHPCHISVNDQGKIVVANYTGGNLGWLSASSDGQLSNVLAVSQHEGSGPTDRQKAPHAHSAWFAGNEVIGVDLGTDELWVYDTDYNLKQKVKMDPGAGPRHLCMHPKKQCLYVINELNNTVTRVVKEEEGWVAAESISTLPANFEGFSFCADIHISSDGKFVYASNRGHNSIAIFKVSDNGTLKAIGYESVRGDHPRNFALSPDERFLIVANKDTQNLVVFKRDAETGFLAYISEIKAASPVCILFD